jgi:hypothetical protein
MFCKAAFSKRFIVINIFQDWASQLTRNAQTHDNALSLPNLKPAGTLIRSKFKKGAGFSHRDDRRAIRGEQC